ncbi:hypothetical protein TWF694_002156 [Orbilia ellipsospora]|uniref:DUF7029 domain-containing protein n=1 Tax=Orbilia ellipsospora TaxID=2528407 RepID=A0AAV9X5V2_9PEZI
MSHSKFICFSLAIGAFSLPAFAGPIRSFISQGSEVSHGLGLNHDGTVLSLGYLRDDEIFPHLRRRTTDLKNLELKDEVLLAFGHGTDVVADIKLMKPNPKTRLLKLEAFDELTKSLECPSGSFKIQFNSKEVLDHALKSWDWIKQDSGNSFYLLVGKNKHQKCSPKQDITPYQVKVFKSDEAAHTVVLTTKEDTWEHVAQNFEFNIGGEENSNDGFDSDDSIGARDVVARGFKDSFLSAVDTVSGVIDPFTPFSKRVLNLTYDQTYENKVLFKKGHGDKVESSIKCVKCSLKGRAKFKAHIGGRNGGATNWSFKFQPNAAAIFDLQSILKGEITKAHTPDLLTIPLFPAIPPIGILSLGVHLVASPGVEGSLSANGALDTNIRWNSKTNLIEAKFHDGSFDINGGKWKTHKPDVEIKPADSAFTAEGKLDAYFKLGLQVGLTVGPVKAVAFAGVTATAANSIEGGHKAGGYCKDEAESKNKDSKGEWGVKFKSEFGIKAGVKVEENVIPDAFKEITNFPELEHHIDIVKPYAIFEHAEHCFAINSS